MALGIDKQIADDTRYFYRSFMSKKKHLPKTGRCFLMIINNIGLHGFIQAYRRRQSILIVKLKCLRFFLKATYG